MTEQTTEQVTEQVEQATEAQAPVASLGLNDLQTVLAIIDTATQRSAFKANELAAVGILYNRVQAFLEAAKAQAAPAPTTQEEAPSDEAGA